MCLCLFLRKSERERGIKCELQSGSVLYGRRPRFSWRARAALGPSTQRGYVSSVLRYVVCTDFAEVRAKSSREADRLEQTKHDRVARGIRSMI